MDMLWIWICSRHMDMGMDNGYGKDTCNLEAGPIFLSVCRAQLKDISCWPVGQSTAGSLNRNVPLWLKGACSAPGLEGHCIGGHRSGQLDGIGSKPGWCTQHRGMHWDLLFPNQPKELLDFSMSHIL